MNKRLIIPLIGLSAAGLTAAVLVRGQEQSAIRPATQPGAATPATAPTAERDVNTRMQALLAASAAAAPAPVAPATMPAMVITTRNPGAVPVLTVPSTLATSGAPATAPAVALAPATEPSAMPTTAPMAAIPVTSPSVTPATGSAGTAIAAAPSGADLLTEHEKQLPQKMRELLMNQRLAAATNPSLLTPLKSTSGPSTGPTTDPAYALRGGPPRSTRTPSKPYPTKGEYAILLQRSIFTRDRRSATGGPDTRPFDKAAQELADKQRGEAIMALMGTAYDDVQIWAFIENSFSSSTQRYKVGDTVARGKIKSITLDEIEYESDGKVTKVAIGQSLDGRPFTPIVSYIPTSPTSLTPSTPGAAPGGGPSPFGGGPGSFDGGGSFGRPGFGGPSSFGSSSFGSSSFGTPGSSSSSYGARPGTTATPGAPGAPGAPPGILPPGSDMESRLRARRAQESGAPR